MHVVRRRMPELQPEDAPNPPPANLPSLRVEPPDKPGAAQARTMH